MRNSLEPRGKEGTMDPVSQLPSQVDGAKHLKCLHILRAQANVTEWDHCQHVLTVYRDITGQINK